MSEERAAEVDRQVVDRQWEGKPARSVVIERAYPTPLDDLWDAIVTPERLARWFLPVSGDLAQGGRYQLEGNAGGTIRRCNPPTYLELSWEMHGGVGWVTLTLTAVTDDETRLALEHIAHEEDDFLAFWAQFGPGSVGLGWDIGLLALADYVDQGPRYAPFDEAAWIATPAGRGFLQTANEDWVGAAIAFGTDPEVARAAGRETFAFYTASGVEQ